MWIQAHTYTSNPVRLLVMLTWAVVFFVTHLCAFLCMCVCALLTTVTVKGGGVSRGTVMNGSVVTSQVQLPLCCPYAACSSIVLPALHVYCVCRERVCVGGFCLNVT